MNLFRRTIFLCGFFATAASSASAATIDDSVEMFMTETPSYLLTAYEGFGPVSANLSLVGTSQTDPSFTITAVATLNPSQDWSVGQIVTSAIPAGYTAPQFIVDVNPAFNGFRSWSLGVKTGGTEAYRMTWKITGQAADNVRPVLLPRFASMPWIGEKKGYVLKGRNTEAFDPGQYPYGPGNVNLTTMLDKMSDAIRRMSNNKVAMTYEIKEARVDSFDCNSIRMTDALLESLGINETNYQNHYQWIVTTLYPSLLAACPLNQTPNGLSNAPQHPHVGPGAWEPDISYPNGSFWSSILQHEFGHGITLSHPQTLYNCAATSPDHVVPEGLFYDCGDQTRTLDSNMGPAAGTWWNPIERARLGWLEGSQVTLVTESGTYDLYSDRDDFTSDPAEPLILQVLVSVNGVAHYVYLTLPNAQNVYDIREQLGNSQPIREEYLHGVQMSAGRLDTGFSTGLGKASHSFFTYSYNGNNGSLFERLARNTIQPGDQVHLKWPGTDVLIKNISREGRHARVQVVYNAGQNQPPVLVTPPSANPATIPFGQPVSLAAAASDPNGDALTYTWDFGDGSTAVGKTVNHVFSIGGSVTVRLTVDDGKAGVVSAETIVHVQPQSQAPVIAPVRFFPPDDIFVDHPVRMTANATDPDGDPLIYTWDFGYGATATGADISHTFIDIGPTVVTLRVADGTGNNPTSVLNINVRVEEHSDLAPVITTMTAVPSAVAVNKFVAFSIAATDPNGDPLSYYWDFGDGTTGFGTKPSHAYAKSGVYTVRAAVSDRRKAAVIGTLTVNVQSSTTTTPAPPPVTPPMPPPTNQNPTVVSMTVFPSGEVRVEEAVRFFATATDPDGDALLYRWEISDGTLLSGNDVVHEFQSAGVYYAVLTVTDGNGGSAVATSTVTVVAPEIFRASSPVKTLFNPDRGESSVIEYNHGSSGHVNISVYDRTGRKIRTIIDQDQPAGTQSATWDGRNDDGSIVAPGVYFLLHEGDLTLPTRKIILIR